MLRSWYKHVNFGTFVLPDPNMVVGTEDKWHGSKLVRGASEKQRHFRPRPFAAAELAGAGQSSVLAPGCLLSTKQTSRRAIVHGPRPGRIRGCRSMPAHLSKDAPRLISVALPCRHCAVAPFTSPSTSHDDPALEMRKISDPWINCCSSRRAINEQARWRASWGALPTRIS